MWPLSLLLALSTLSQALLVQERAFGGDSELVRDLFPIDLIPQPMLSNSEAESEANVAVDNVKSDKYGVRNIDEIPLLYGAPVSQMRMDAGNR